MSYTVDENGPMKDDAGVECIVIWGPDGEGNGRAAIVYDEVADELTLAERAQAVAAGLNLVAGMIKLGVKP